MGLKSQRLKDNETAFLALLLLSSHKRLTEQWTANHLGNPLIPQIPVQAGGGQKLFAKKPDKSFRHIRQPTKKVADTNVTATNKPEPYRTNSQTQKLTNSLN